MASPARPARGRDPSVRSPLSPFVTPRPHSHPPSQQTQQPGRRRDGPQASSSTAGVRRELPDSSSDEENEEAADAPSLQPRPVAKKAKLPTAKQVAMDFVRAFLEGTSPADKRARFFTRPPGPAEEGTPFEAADWPQLSDFVSDNFRCGGAVTSGVLWRAQVAVEPFNSRVAAANRSDTAYGPRDHLVARMKWATGVQLISTSALRAQGQGVFDLGLKALWKGPPPAEDVELYKHATGLLVQWDARRLRSLAALEEYGKRDPVPARRLPPAAASTGGAGEASPPHTAAAGEAPAAAPAGRGAGGKQRAAAPPSLSHDERLQAHDEGQQQVNALYNGHAIVDVSRQHLEALGQHFRRYVEEQRLDGGVELWRGFDSWARLLMPPEHVTYPLHPDQREFFCIVKKVNDARTHESGYAKTAAAHLLRDAEAVAQWAARRQQAAETESQRAVAQAAALRAQRVIWAAEADDSEDSEDGEPTADEEVRARAALAREEQRAACSELCQREQPPDVIEDAD